MVEAFRRFEASAPAYVYCILRTVAYEGDTLLAVYANKAKAIAAANMHNTDETISSVSYHVEQQPVII